VDKPNASLSAERRGTLSIPDIYSFIKTDQNNLIYETSAKPPPKKKPKKRDRDSEDEVVRPTMGSRTRPRAVVGY
jgi:hypothetical protein